MQWVPVFYFFNNTFKIHTVWIWRIVLSLTALLYLPFPSVCHREVLLVLYLVWLWRWKPTLQLTWMNVDCRPGSGSYQLATINFCMTRSVPFHISTSSSWWATKPILLKIAASGLDSSPAHSFIQTKFIYASKIIPWFAMIDGIKHSFGHPSWVLQGCFLKQEG